MADKKNDKNQESKTKDVDPKNASIELAAERAGDGTDAADIKSGQEAVAKLPRTTENISSNSPEKPRKQAEHVEFEADQDKRATPSTSGPKGTEEEGSDKGPGGTGW